MSGNINIEPEVAISCGNQITQYSENFKSEVAEIYSIIDDLKKVWTGSSAERFTRDIETFREDYNKFGILLTNFGDVLSSIGRDYKSLEEDM